MSMERTTIAFAVAMAVFGVLGCDNTKPTGETPAPSAAASGKPAAAPASGQAPQATTVRASGSSALQPLINAAKEKFEATHKDASIEVSAGGSKKGLNDVKSGAVHLGNSDIFAPDDMKEGLVDHKVAVVGFAAMANKGPFNAKVKSLTMKQLADIFTGTVKNWKEVGGDSQAITVINRAAGSGTRTVVGNIVLGGDKFVESQTEDNSGALVTKLKQSKGAISYLAISFQDPELTTFAIKVDKDDVDPTSDNITAGKYPIWSYEHVYTKGEPTASTKDFVDFLLSPGFQKDVVPTVKGFIPVTAMKVSRQKD